jgi:hypothetical protein
MHPAITEQLTFEHTRELRARGDRLAVAGRTSSRRNASRLTWLRARLNLGHRQPLGVVVPLVHREA